MRLIIEPTYDAVSRWAANYVVSVSYTHLRAHET